MLSIGKLSGGRQAADYYLTLRQESLTSAAGYYMSSANVVEPAGQWFGSALETVGLKVGEVDDGVFRQLLEHHSVGDKELGRKPRRGDGLAAYDLTFSAPKSVSLLMAFGDPEIASKARAAHYAGVVEAMKWMEVEACGVRVARGEEVTDAAGRQRTRTRYTRVDGVGFLGARFEQFTSRALDPQLHTHHVIVNKTMGPDGEWRTLDGQRLYLAAKAAGTVYQSEMRRHLTLSTGVEWSEVANGMAEIAGFDRAVVEHYSARRRQILERVAVMESPHSARALQAATSQTRPRKGAPDAAAVHQRWQELEQSAPHDIRRLVRAATPGPTLATELVFAADAAGSATNAKILRALVQKAPTFSQADVVVEAANHLPGALNEPQALTQVAERWMRWANEVDELVPLLQPAGLAPPPITLTDAETARMVDRGWMIQAVREDGSTRDVTRLRWVSGQQRYTTRSLLLLERQALDGALEVVDRPVVRADLVRQALAGAPTLLASQSAMIEHVAASDRRAVAVVGPGGSGKTFAVSTLARAIEADGRVVIGVAVSGAATDELARAANVEGFTVARLQYEALMRGNAEMFPVGIVVVIDEASMIDTSDLAWLTSRVTEAQGRLIMVGDPAQLPSVGAGGVFHRLVADGMAVDDLLGVNVRQQLEVDRTALSQLRAGNVGGAMAGYKADNRIHLSETSLDAMQEMVRDWWGDVAAHGLTSTRMLAATRADAATLNAFARAQMRVEGQLSGEPLEVEGREFQVGDRVVATKNSRRYANLRNSHSATVVGVKPKAGSVTIKRDVDGAEIRLDRSYVEDHLAHGYATTIHKAQGATFSGPTRVYSDLEGATRAEHGYVALSRSRRDSHLYFGADQMADNIAHGVYTADKHPPVDRLTEQLGTSVVAPLGVDSGRPVRAVSTDALVLRRTELGTVLRVGPPNVSAELEQANAALVEARGRAALPGASTSDTERLATIVEQQASLAHRALERQRWLEEHGPLLREYVDITTELNERIDRRVVELVVDPRVREILGDAPRRGASDPEAEAWRKGALAYAELEQRHGVLDAVRRPYVGEGTDGAQRSAQIDREEIDTLDPVQDAERIAALGESASQWETQARWQDPHLIAPLRAEVFALREIRGQEIDFTAPAIVETPAITHR